MEEETMRGKIGGSGRPSPLASPSSEAESESTSTTYTVDGSHELVIKGYSLLKGLGIGQYVFSDKFQVGGHLWAIYFYPDGKNQEDNAVYVSLFVALAGEATDVRALFELTMVDQTGAGNHKIHSHFGRNPASGPYTLKYQGSMWGFKRFYRRMALDASDYLKDDCLTIRCRVGVVKSRTDAPRQESIPVPSPCIAEHFGKLLESGEATDVSFQVDGEIFSAHKLVLAARSPVFRAQLFGPMKDKDTELIVIEDMEAPVFKAFLHFIYWDTLMDMEEITGFSAKCASTLMAQHLLDAADRYALERLKIICEDMLCKNIAINTVSTTLALAEQHNCLHLKSMCLKFIAQSGNLRAVMQTDGFEHLKMSCPHLSFELLKYVAQVGENSANYYTCSSADAQNLIPDGSDAGGRRVKQRR